MGPTKRAASMDLAQQLTCTVVVVVTGPNVWFIHRDIMCSCFVCRRHGPDEASSLLTWRVMLVMLLTFAPRPEFDK